MNIRHAFLGLLPAILLLPGAGCRKSEPSASSPPPAWSAPSPETVVRVHWLGKKRLGIEAGAYYLMRLWTLPETAALENQTLDMLSSAPWRALYGQAQVTNVYAVLLRPLLNDVVQEECYFEIKRAPNQPEELVFAIRLEESRAGTWETNLANVVQSLTGTWPVASGRHGWTMQQIRNPKRIEMFRAGEWLLLGAAQDRNSLLAEIAGRVRSHAAPFGTPSPAHWLDVDLDLRRANLIPAGEFSPPGNLPGISIAISGDGGNALTHAELNFPQPLDVNLEPWRISTNRIQEPLVSLTAMRGIQSWLASWKTWSDLGIGAPPNQFCSWAPDGIPQQMFFETLVADGSNGANQIRGLSEVLVRKGNPWLASHGMGTFEPAPDQSGVMWTGLPLVSPCARVVEEGRLVFGALIPSMAPGTNTQVGLYTRPPLADLLQELSAHTNLVYFDWELAGPRIESWFYISQALRTTFRRPQLPFDSTGLVWLNAVRTRLGNSKTLVTRTGPNQLSFDRKSTLGLTGAELHLLADWLESPRFPWGLHSSAATNE